MKNNNELMVDLRDGLVSVLDSTISNLSPDAKIKLANCCHKAGLHAICVGILEHETWPRSEIQFLIGDAYYDLARFEESIIASTKLLDIEPSSIAFNNRGQAYAVTGKFAIAKAVFLDAIKYDGTNLSAIISAGDLCLKLEDGLGAVGFYERVLSIDPNNATSVI